MNGATQTFRRPSVATNAQNRESSQTTSASTPTSAAYIPANPSSNTQARNPSTSDARYSKDKLLEIFKNQRDSGSLGKNLTDFFVANWNPLEETSTTNGAIGKDNPKGAALGAEVCWDHAGQFEPLGLTELTDDEKEVHLLPVWERRRNLANNSLSCFLRPSTPRSSPHHLLFRRTVLVELVDGRHHSPTLTCRRLVPAEPHPGVVKQRIRAETPCHRVAEDPASLGTSPTLQLHHLRSFAEKPIIVILPSPRRRINHGRASTRRHLVV